MVNLRILLEQTGKAWQHNLDQMHARSQYILGPQVACFEQEFAQALGAKHAVGVSSGTTAIELCLRDAAVTNQVVTSAFTAPFTGVAIQAAGATPVFADVDPETLLVDFDDAANRIGEKTGAVVPVHLYGQPCNLSKWRSASRSTGVVIVQDACQAHGASFAGKPFTDFSSYVAYSFYPTKNLGCLGDGGAIVTSNSKIASRLNSLRDGGRKKGEQVSRVRGINARLDEMQACYLRAFLPHLETWNTQRAHLAALYDQAFADCPAVQPLRRAEGSVNHLYVIRVPRRDALQLHLAASGIGSTIHYPVPLHLHPAFSASKQKRGDLPNSEKAAKRILSLPLWPGMTNSQASEVADKVRQFLGY